MKLSIILFFLSMSFLIKGQPTNPWSPPEYFPSKAVIMEWDFNTEIWQLYSDLIQEIKTEAEVILVVNNQDDENTFIGYLNNAGISLENISFVHLPTSGRIWTRDHGPKAVQTDNGTAYIDFDDFAHSYESSYLPTNLANLWGIDSYQLYHIILDGGNFMVDSYGNYFGTDRLYTNNPEYSQQYIDDLLLEYMGIQNIYTFTQMGPADVWGHIDMQMKLLDDTTFVISSIEEGFPDHQYLEDNYIALTQLTGPYGTPYRIERLPKAENWKTYANSLIINNKVIVPIYDDPNDDIAISVYEELMPNHEIVGINANSIVGWGGVIHCITMQVFDDDYITYIKNLSVKDKLFSVFPNPLVSGGDLNFIIADGYSSGGILKIFDISGKLLFQEEYYNTNTLSKRIDLSPGIYLVEILSNNTTEIKRLVVK